MGELAELVVDQTDLGQRDEPVLDAEQLEDAQVLLGLRLPSLGAATTKMQASMAPTPASMFLRNRSWPGTSTIA